MNVHATLSAEARHDKVWITFKIENRGERRIWLPRTMAADAVLTGPLFHVTRLPEDVAVAYIGAHSDKVPVGASDYLELAPHSAHTHTIDITPAYAFAAGVHDYRLHCVSGVLGDIHQPEAVTALETEPVVFRHAA